jgi:hypothetical protein
MNNNARPRDAASSIGSDGTWKVRRKVAVIRKTWKNRGIKGIKGAHTALALLPVSFVPHECGKQAL